MYVWHRRKTTFSIRSDEILALYGVGSRADRRLQLDKCHMKLLLSRPACQNRLAVMNSH